jgi:hypothetical protein
LYSGTSESYQSDLAEVGPGAGGRRPLPFGGERYARPAARASTSPLP